MNLQETLPVLLSWAVHLSGYPSPDEVPAIVYEPHSFFVERVCGGRECTAVGWYDDRHVIYVDEKYKEDEGSFATSLVVHELTHYLQHQSGEFDSHSCSDSVAREREAYHVQNSFLITARGSVSLIRPSPTSCQYSAVAAEGRRGWVFDGR